MEKKKGCPDVEVGTQSSGFISVPLCPRSCLHSSDSYKEVKHTGERGGAWRQRKANLTVELKHNLWLAGTLNIFSLYPETQEIVKAF